MNSTEVSRPLYLNIKDVAMILKAAPRLGTATDTPEGSRYILLSDTLVQHMILGLERHWRTPNDICE